MHSFSSYDTKSYANSLYGRDLAIRATKSAGFGCSLCVNAIIFIKSQLAFGATSVGQ